MLKTESFNEHCVKQ